MANESGQVCQDAILLQRIGNKREYEDEDHNEVITKKKKTCEHGSPVTLNKNDIAPKIICVRNLSYSVERADMEDIFKGCGEVVDVRFITDCEGRFRGFGFVKFGTVEAVDKALKLNNTKLLNRRIKVGKVREKSEYPPYRSSIQTGENIFSDTVKGFDASLVENKPRSPATPNELNDTSKTIYVGNLSYTVERADMEKLFKNYGEIVDVRLHTDREGMFNGHGHVQFATKEAAQKALAMNKKVFFNRPMVVDLARERCKYSPNKSFLDSNISSWSIQFQKCGSFQPLTVFVIGFNTFLAKEKITANLHNHFKSCGEIARISLPRCRDSGAIKGYAHLDFKDVNGYKKALKLNQTAIEGYWVSVEKAT